jgi:predicted ATPase
MYSSFQIRDFRCFPELTVDSLDRINLIAGKNNVGKTAFLEALFLFCGAYRPDLVLSLNANRGIEHMKIQLGKWNEGPWTAIFRNFDLSKEVIISGQDGSEMSRTIRINEVRDTSQLAELPRPFQEGASGVSTIIGLLGTSKVLRLRSEDSQSQRDFYLIFNENGISSIPQPPAPPFPGFFLASSGRAKNEEITDLFSTLSRQKKVQEITEHLKIIEPRLTSLSIETFAGQPYIHADIGLDQTIALPFVGEGTVRLLFILTRIRNAVGGMVLIDEIENGIHHSVMGKVWRVIGDMARDCNCQVLATTHSLECIRAAHQAFSESEIYDFRLHRLDRRGDGFRAVTYDREALESAEMTRIEVR